MRYSSYFIFSSKEKPSTATNKSHNLLLRASYISQLAAGIYNFLPLGFRVLKKIWKIVEEEMDRIGALQVLMPAVHPSQLWEKTGRWYTMDNVMFKFQDKKGVDMVLGTTHEEIITDIVANYVKSYKNLPLLLYQIQVKFRDEIRPKGGLIRAREFIMKDLYSFHTSWECLDKTYQDVYKAYVRIFERLSIPVEVVEAFSGPIGGDVSHEFMLVTEAGEDKFVKCTSCGYAASTEIAKIKKPDFSYHYKPLENYNKVFTPSVKSVDELVNFLSRKREDFIKSILFKIKGDYVLVLVRGDKEVNEIKLAKVIGEDFELAQEFDFDNIGSVMGFIGPIGLKKKIRIIADFSVVGLKNCIVGANEKDYHFVGVDYDNINIDEFADVSFAIEGDFCYKCGGRYRIFPALELGHIFKLGTKYSEPLEAYFVDKDGQRKPIIMGCYGIGVSRLMSAVLEAYSQENSMCWTFNSAPFFVYLITINIDDEKQFEVSKNIYEEMKRKGIEVLWDDRKESAGTKFKDWQLIGIPLCVVVGNKINQNFVEIKINPNFPELKYIDKEIKKDEKEVGLNLSLEKLFSFIEEIYRIIDNKLNAY
ncbi:MAG: proline--tRNA ligase [bacterium]